MLTDKNKLRDDKLYDRRVNATFRRKALAVLADLRGQGIPLVVVEVYRSPARAMLMKLQGKSKIGAQSKHCKGLAMDCAFQDSKSGITWSVSRKWWDKYGSSAEAHGLTWGDRWKMKDTNHVEL